MQYSIYKKILSSSVAMMIMLLIGFTQNSCSRNVYKLKPVTEKEKAVEKANFPAPLVKEFEAGTDYFATGNKPSDWSLKIDEEGVFAFSVKDKNSLSLNAVRPLRIKTGRQYVLTDRAGTMTINIFDRRCPGGKNSNETEVIFNGVLYSGCGNALYDYKLDGNFVLTAINNTKVTAADFSDELPFLKIDLSNSSLSGSTGCKLFKTSISASGQKLNVGQAIAGKRTNCSNKTVEQKLSKFFFNQVVSGGVKGNNLYLYLADDSVLTYEKN